jgi:hypothetical protein
MCETRLPAYAKTKIHSGFSTQRKPPRFLKKEAFAKYVLNPFAMEQALPSGRRFSRNLLREPRASLSGMKVDENQQYI